MQRDSREALGSPHVDSRPARMARRREALVAAGPAQRLGQGARHRRRRRDPRPRHRPAAQLADPRPADPQGDAPQRRRLAVATERPTALDGGAEAIARYAPGGATPLPLRARAGAGRRERFARSPRRCATPAGRGHLGRADRPRGRRRRAPCSTSPRRSPRGHRGLRPARSPRLRQRPRPARGRLPPRRRPGPHAKLAEPGKVHRGDPRRAWSPARSSPCSSSAWTRSATSPTPKPGSEPSPPPTTSSSSRPSRPRPRPSGRRRLPARDPRRERRHGHPPRRPPAASPPRRSRPGDIRPNWGVLAELSSRPRPRHRRSTSPAHRPSQRSSDAVPFYAGHRRRGDRRSRRSLAGHRDGGCGDPSLSAPAPDLERDARHAAARGDSATLATATAERGAAVELRPCPPRHLPRPLGRTDHRAEPAAEVPAPQQRVEMSVADAERWG